MDSRISSHEGGGSGLASDSYRHPPVPNHISILINEKINSWSEEQPSDGSRERIPYPEILNEEKSHFFEPQFIRIGPYHPTHSYEDKVQFKYGFLVSLRSRAGGEKFVNDCTEKIWRVAAKMKDLYDQDKVRVGEEEFVKRLVIDGCFVVEYLHQRTEYRKHCLREFGYPETQAGRKKPEYHLLFRKKHMIPVIDDDLLLLINQLPLSLFDTIYHIAFPEEAEDHFSTTIAFKFVSSILDSHTKGNNFLDFSPELGKGAQHFLHMYHKISTGLSVEDDEDDDDDLLMTVKNTWKEKLQRLYCRIIFRYMIRWQGWRYDFYNLSCEIPSAAFLHESGIELKRPEGSILSVESRHGPLEIPLLVVNPSTLRLLKNLCEMEKQCPHIKNSFTEYIKFMDQIINTKDDVTILRRKHIIQHTYGNDKEAAERINELMSGESIEPPVIPFDSYFFETIININMLLASKRRMMWVSFKQRYFSSPWSFFALISAFVLLVLTFLQTFYTVRGYYYPPHV